MCKSTQQWLLNTHCTGREPDAPKKSSGLCQCLGGTAALAILLPQKEWKQIRASWQPRTRCISQDRQDGATYRSCFQDDLHFLNSGRASNCMGASKRKNINSSVYSRCRSQ